MKKISIKKIIAASVISLVLIQLVYIAMEPTIVDANTQTANVVVTLNVTSGVSISNTTSNLTTMTPNMGVGQHKSIGQSSFIVTTNSATGYTLSMNASTAPALKNGAVDSFADYTPTVVNTPELWSVSSGTKEFGYSVYSVLGSDHTTAVGDVATATWGNKTGTTCGTPGTGVTDATLKYRDFTTSTVQVGSRASVTPVSGIETFICFGAEENNVFASAGTYTATITATATAS